MPRQCLTCSSKDRSIIDSLLIEGTISLRTISDRFGISHQSLIRHRDLHISKELKQAYEFREIARIEKLENQVKFLLAESLQNYKRAKENANRTLLKYKHSSISSCTQSLEQVRRVITLYAMVRQEQQVERLISVVRKEVGDPAAEYIKTGRGGKYEPEQIR